MSKYTNICALVARTQGNALRLAEDAIARAGGAS